MYHREKNMLPVYYTSEILSLFEEWNIVHLTIYMAVDTIQMVIITMLCTACYLHRSGFNTDGNSYNIMCVLLSILY